MRTPTNLTQPLIIIADEDEDERGLLRAILKLKGFNVIEAVDGQEAIDMVMDEHPDLLVVDLKLPRVSGSAAIRRIRRRAALRNLPIVAVSTAFRSTRVWQTLEGESTAHLQKPIEYDELDALIDRFLPGRRLSLT